MSDLADGSLEALESELGPRITAAVPVPTPGEVESARLRIFAQDRKARVAAAHRGRLRIIATAAVLAAAVAAACIWQVRSAPAFASQNAIKVLRASDGILHAVYRVSTGPASSKTTVELWIDPAGERSHRTESENGMPRYEDVDEGPKGNVRSVEYLSADESSSVLASPPGPPFEYGSLIDQPRSTLPPASWSDGPDEIEWWAELCRALEDGAARVQGPVVVAGTRCWKVWYREPGFTQAKAVVFRDGKWVADPDPAAISYRRTTEALLRVGDYVPVRATVELDTESSDYSNGIARPRSTVTTSTYEIQEWRQLPLDTVPAGTFDTTSLEASRSANLELHYLPSQVASLTVFSVWGLESDALGEGASDAAPDSGNLQPDSGMFTYRWHAHTPAADESTDPILLREAVGSLATASYSELLNGLSSAQVVVSYGGTGASAVVTSIPNPRDAVRRRFLNQLERTPGAVPMAGSVSGRHYQGVAFPGGDSSIDGVVTVVADGGLAIVGYRRESPQAKSAADCDKQMRKVVTDLVLMNPDAARGGVTP